ncbi:hypothetical protein [Vreelandella alkaliphila]|uniref:hypothetical protein n=1 Tax=Vreelandella alkaliphila TaxID=272774 RepID=UPI003F96A4AC
MSVNDIKHLAVATIYLVPDASEGQRCYLWCDDPAPGLDMDPSESVEYLRKDVHDAIIAKQANAAKQGMDAAKKVAGSNLEQAKRLNAESSPAALESEREANARLTELVTQLERDRDDYRAAEELQLALRRSIQDERDALAAHVERLAEATEFCNEHHYFGGWTELLDGSPATSLTRRDLIKQSEALVALYNDCLGNGGDGMVRCAIMLDRAIELREEAEGHQ